MPFRENKKIIFYNNNYDTIPSPETAVLKNIQNNAKIRLKSIYTSYFKA